MKRFKIVCMYYKQEALEYTIIFYFPVFWLSHLNILLSNVDIIEDNIKNS